MAKYLSDDERQLLKDVHVFLKEAADPTYGASWNEANAVGNGHAEDRLHDGYSDDELTRLAKAFPDCFGYFSKRLNKQDAVIAMIIECAQEARLPAIEVLKVLEDLPKRKKLIPSVAEFNEMFTERKELLKRASYESGKVILELRDESKETLKSLADAVDGFREFIPDFPDADDLAKFWKQVTGTHFGIIPYECLGENRRMMTAFREGMQAGEFWPAVPLYCLHLAAQIPAEKLPAAIQHVFDLWEEDTETGNLPMHWHSAIANEPSLSTDGEAVMKDWLPPVPAYYLYCTLDPCHRDEINANWEAKLDAASSFPKPIQQQA